MGKKKSPKIDVKTKKDKTNDWVYEANVSACGSYSVDLHN